MQVEIYGATWCTSCTQVKKLCETMLVEYTYIDVDDTPSLVKLEERLGHKIKTVPQIFVNGEHVPTGLTGLRQALAA